MHAVLLLPTSSDIYPVAHADVDCAGKPCGITISIGEHNVSATSLDQLVELPGVIENHTTIPDFVLRLTDSCGCQTTPDAM